MHVCLGKACDRGPMGHPFPSYRTTIMGGSALSNQKNTIQHKPICHSYPYPARTMTLSLASRQNLAKLTE